MEMWKTSVITTSDLIFPGLAYYDKKKEFYGIGMRFLTRNHYRLQVHLNMLQMVPSVSLLFIERKENVSKHFL